MPSVHSKEQRSNNEQTFIVDDLRFIDFVVVAPWEKILDIYVKEYFGDDIPLKTPFTFIFGDINFTVKFEPQGSHTHIPKKDLSAVLSANWNAMIETQIDPNGPPYEYLKQHTLPTLLKHKDFSDGFNIKIRINGDCGFDYKILDKKSRVKN